MANERGQHHKADAGEPGGRSQAQVDRQKLELLRSKIRGSG